MDYRVGLPSSIRSIASPAAPDRGQTAPAGQSDETKTQRDSAPDEAGTGTTNEFQATPPSTFQEALSIHLYGPRDQSRVVPRAVGGMLDLRG